MEEYMKNISNSSVRKQNYVLSNSYQIGDFDPKDFDDITGGVVAIIAPTGAGKTVLLRYILSQTHKKYKKIVMMSRTAKLQKVYDFMPRSMIVDDYDEQMMSNIWDEQIKRHKEKKKLENVLIILDDIIASPSYKKSKMLDEYAVAARQVNITVIVLSQYFTSIKPLIRANIRIAFSFQLSSKREREKFVQQFLATDNEAAGELLFERITGVKYQALVVQVYKCGDPISEKVKKVIAPLDAPIDLKEPEEDHILKQRVLVRPMEGQVSRVLKKKGVRAMGSKYGI